MVTLFTELQKAGWPIYPLLIASVLGLALIIERLLYLRARRVLPPTLLSEVIRVYQNGKVDVNVINTLENNSPLGRVLAAGLRNVDAPRDVMKESIEEAGRGAAHELERFLTSIGTIATLAPLMGLFGTVVGMIEIFGSQNAGGADPTERGAGLGRRSPRVVRHDDVGHRRVDHPGCHRVDPHGRGELERGGLGEVQQARLGR